MYTEPVQFEPLLIGEGRPGHPDLIEMAQDLREASARLDAVIPEQTGLALAELVSGMNCYYSNLIEGHHTLPVDIDKAMRHDFSGNAEQQRNQHMADAHMETDRWARTRQIDSSSILLFILEVHRRFCEKLPQSMLIMEDGRMMVPGKLRKKNVEVGNHVAPDYTSLDSFLQRYAAVYGRTLYDSSMRGTHLADAVIASMAAHHRLLWVHPFEDGNGRAARIVLDAMLLNSRLNTRGLWSMSRGFAKTEEKYKRRLAEADLPRMGDLDGRGNLSEKKLSEFCMYAMATGKDQAQFMGKMFALGSMESRCTHYFKNMRIEMKPESAFLYIHAFRNGEFERGEAPRITGLAERTARDVLGLLINEGFLISNTPKGRVRAGFPVHAIGTFFPNLYPSGDVDFIRKSGHERGPAVEVLDDLQEDQQRQGSSADDRSFDSME